MSSVLPSLDKTALRRDVDALIRDVAEKAVVPRFQNLSDSDVRTKSGPGDLVTAADEEAEELLHEGLARLLPSSLVLGEEAAAADPSVLSHLAQPEPVWVIDPVDGTANFVAGNAAFAVVVALVEAGQTLMGWIHEPLEARTVWAGYDQGAWIGDRRLILDSRTESDLSAMAAAHYHRAFKSSLGAFANTRRSGSAAHEYWALAENRIQVSSFSRLMPWDHAAGVLIHTEAGGYSRMIDGALYNPADEQKRGLLSAPSQKVWAMVRALADENCI